MVDTIDASPNQAYVLAVLNGDGTPVVGTTVVFSGENASVAAPGGVFQASASLLTDSRGEVAVVVRYGERAGPGEVITEVPTVMLADTLRIDVRPGAPVTIGITPADTAVVVGVSFALSAAQVDRHGNAAGAALPVSVDFGPLSAVGSQFMGTAVGEARVSAHLQDLTAFATVRVVPDGEIVYTKSSEAWLVHFDGSDPRKLGFNVPPVQEPSVSWDPAGGRMVLGGYEGFVVFDVGNRTISPTTWPGGAAGSNVLWPRFGPQGRIYYSSSDGQGAWDLRHANPDASAAQIMIPSNRFPNNDFFPDWAPNEGQFVFTADWEEYHRFLLRLSNPSADVLTTINIEGVTPVWSPDGTLIAFQELGVVGVVAPDQSISRSWNAGWSKGVTWSPDNDMLVGIAGGRIALIDIETGNTLTLTHFGLGIDAVAWRPR